MSTITPEHKSIDDQLRQILTPSGKSYYHVQIQKTRITAIVLAMATIISLIFLVFAFIQKAAADRAREEAIKYEKIAVENEVRARQFQAEWQRCQQINNK